MNGPFPMTRVAGAALIQLLRLYLDLPRWLMIIVGIAAFVWVAKG